MKKVLLLTVICFTLILAACSGSNSTSSKDSKSKDAYPSETLNVIIPFGPGGGTDLHIRKIIEIVQKNDWYNGDIKIENREGGSGAVGWGFVNSKKGDPYVLTATSASLFTTPLVSDLGFTYESFTPVALMGADDLFLLVKEESDIKTLDDFIAAAKSKKLKIGGVGQVSDEMIIPNMFAEAAGFEFDYVPFQGAGELTSALLSDSLDAIVGNPTRALGQIEGGLMRPLAFSGVERFPALEDVATFTELGYEVNLSQPRGVLLAGEVDESVQQYWIDTIKKVYETDEWKQFVEENGLSDRYLEGDEFKALLDETSEKYSTSIEKYNK